MKLRRLSKSAGPTIAALLSAFASQMVLSAHPAQASGFLWQETFGGTAQGDDQPNTQIVDCDGNLIVSGMVTDKDKGICAGTVKYDSAGHLLWSQLESRTQDDTWKNGLAVRYLNTDSSNNVTIVASGYNGVDSTSATTESYAHVVRYSARGAFLSHMLLDLGPVGTVFLEKAIFAPNGDIYTESSGERINKGGDSSYSYWQTQRFSSSGKLIWTRLFNGHNTPGFHDGEPYTGGNDPDGFALDSQGNVVVSGDETIDYAQSLVVRKYTPDAKLIFSSTYDPSPSNDYIYGGQLLLDAGGNIYVSGLIESFIEGGQEFQGTISRLSPSGKFLWTRVYGLPTESNYAFDLAFDTSGNILGASSGTNVNGVQQNTIVKLKPSGATIFTEHSGMPSPATSQELQLFASQKTDDFYILGQSTIYDASTFSDKSSFYVTKYNPDGTIADEQDYYAQNSDSYRFIEGAAFDPATESIYPVLQKDVTPNGFNYRTDDLDWLIFKYNLGE